jgi:hypothetical protein
MAALEELLEAGKVELVRLEPKDIPRPLRRQHLERRPRHVRWLEELPQIGDIGLDRRLRLTRRAITPQLIDQPIRGNHPIRIDQEQRKHSPLLGTPERQPPLAVPDLERTEDPILELRQSAERTTESGV